jgi:hypothetical protein
MLSTAAQAERISVAHIQLPRHAAMLARTETGKVIGRVEFTQVVLGDEVTMRLTYHFVDGSIDDETTTYRQQRTFQLVRDHHIQQRPAARRTRVARYTSRASTSTCRKTWRMGSLERWC